MLAQVFATCIFMAAQTYQVPPAVLMGIMEVEGGKVGQQVKNTNKTHDLGPMQINSIWIPELARHWNISYNTAYQWVRDDACTNIHVAAWILKNKSDNAGSLYTGIMHYHSATPKYGLPYRQKVIKAMQDKGLLAKPDTQLADMRVVRVQ